MPESELSQTIGEMLATFEGQEPEPEPAPVEPEPAQEPEQVEMPVEEPVEELPVEEPVLEPVAEEQPVEQAEEVEDEEGPDILELVQQQNEMLRNYQEQLAQMQLQGSTGSPHSQEAEVEQPTQPQPQAPAVPDLTQEQFEQVLGSPEAFKQYLTQVQQQAQAQVLEQVTQRLSKLVNQSVSHQVSVSAMVSNFFKDNADLLPYRNQVGIIANELLSQNPGLSYADLFKQVGEQAREKLKPLLMAQKTRTVKRPGFAGRQSTVRSQQKPQLSPEQTEIEEMLSLTF